MTQVLHRRHSTEPPPGATQPVGTIATAPAPSTDRGDSAQSSVAAPEVGDDRQPVVVRVAAFSPSAPILGGLVAWGAITTATVILDRAGVDVGFNLGIAHGGTGDDGFIAGLWLLLVSVGAFVAGGYTAARLARNNGIRHAGLVWAVALVATLVDAVVESIGNGVDGVIREIDGVPFWAETGLTDGYERTVVLAIFAAAQLIGCLVGGGLGQLGNRAGRVKGERLVQSSAVESTAGMPTSSAVPITSSMAHEHARADTQTSLADDDSTSRQPATTGTSTHTIVDDAPAGTADDTSADAAVRPAPAAPPSGPLPAPIELDWSENDESARRESGSARDESAAREPDTPVDPRRWP